MSRHAFAFALIPSAALLVGWAVAAGDSAALERAQAAFQRQDWTAAERECRAAIQEDAQNPRAHELLGMVYVARQDFDSAAAPLRRACQLSPRHGLACYYLGRNYYALGNYVESRAVLEQALKTAPRSDRIRIGLALTLEALGQIDTAAQHLQQAVRGGSRDALAEYGRFLFRQGRLPEAIGVLHRAGDRETLARAQKQLAAASAVSTPSAPATPVQFTAAELPMTVHNGAAGARHQVETMLAGVAVLDYDNDGWPDLYVCNGATVPALDKTDPKYANRLLRNNRDGTFTDVTDKAGVAGHGYSMGAAAADYDNDGWPDLYITGVRSNTLYRNRGDGVFEDVTARAGVAGGGLWAVAAGWFDYDSDGLLDLFVVRYVAWDPATEPYCGDTRPGYRSYCHPKYYTPLPNALYRNQGDGTFRDVSVDSGIAAHLGKGMGVAFADYDRDGHPDVFIANDTVPSFLFHNLGNGRFEEVAVARGVAFNGDGRATSTMGADFRDYDNDGWDDLFETALSNEGFTLFRNLGRGAFSEVSQSAGIAAPSLLLGGWSTGMFDFNNDGFKDIFSANGHADDNIERTTSLESRQANSLFLNRGNGTFDVAPLPGKALHRGAAFGDFNRDGRVDVVVTRLNEPPLLLTNTTASRNHWLDVRLRGHASNRDGLGARLHLVTDSGSQWNHVTTSVGYAGSSEPVAHFGLGKDAIVRTLDVDWPSGVHQSLHGLAPDRLLLVEEPR